jgi:hypothetical protein
MLQAVVVEPTRLGHETPLQRAHRGAQRLARKARRACHAEHVGDRVVVLAHAQLAVVAGVHDALRARPEQRCHAGPRQVVGMDVVGVDVVLGRQQRRRTRQALARVAAVAVECIDARHAQHAGREAEDAAMPAYALLGVDAALRARGEGRHGARLVEACATGIAVDPGRARVDQAPRPRRPRQGLQQGGRARVVNALWRRRRQVQHPVRQRGQTPQCGRLVQVADQRQRAGRAQHRPALRARTQRHHAHAAAQQPQHAQTDVAAADDQQRRTAHGATGQGHRGNSDNGCVLQCRDPVLRS